VEQKRPRNGTEGDRGASIFLPQRPYCSGTLTLDGLVCTLRDTELYTKG
jgi:hypothetical protein